MGISTKKKAQQAGVDASTMSVDELTELNATGNTPDDRSRSAKAKDGIAKTVSVARTTVKVIGVVAIASVPAAAIVGYNQVLDFARNGDPVGDTLDLAGIERAQTCNEISPSGIETSALATIDEDGVAQVVAYVRPNGHNNVDAQLALQIDTVKLVPELNDKGEQVIGADGQPAKKMINDEGDLIQVTQEKDSVVTIRPKNGEEIVNIKLNTSLLQPNEAGTLEAVSACSTTVMAKGRVLGD